MASQERLVMEIKSLSDAIRQKHDALKSGIIERERYLESTFKPVVDPLKEITEKLDSSNIMKTGKHDDDDSSSKVNTETISESISDEKEDGNLSEVSNFEDGTVKSESDDTITNPTNLSILGTDISKKGKLSRQYLVKMLDSNQSNRRYHTYGARLENNGLMIGNAKLEIDDQDNLLIKGKRYPGSRGLFELIFKPKPVTFTQKDLKTYKVICKSTNLHKKQYSPSGAIHRNSSVKYKTIISTLFPSKHARGSGMVMKNSYDTNVIYYNNVNKLVDRMKLLYEAQRAGHTGVGNEMVALIAELRSRGYIN